MRLPDLDLRLYLPRPPFWLVAFIVVSLVGSWVPLALIAWQRVNKHDKPRYHIFLDMDNQAKLKTQKASPVFADGRTMRPRVPGTVARGELALDDHFERGYEVNSNGETVYFAGYPEQVQLDMALLKTGQVRFDTFCAPCHGTSGNGKGTVQLRAQKLTARGNTGTAWTQVANLHAAGDDGSLTFGEAAYPNGKLYNTISNGKGAMNGYAAQIEPADRWAIVAYVRALQLSQNPDAPVAADTAADEPVALNTQAGSN